MEQPQSTCRISEAVPRLQGRPPESIVQGMLINLGARALQSSGSFFLYCDFVRCVLAEPTYSYMSMLSHGSCQASLRRVKRFELIGGWVAISPRKVCRLAFKQTLACMRARPLTLKCWQALISLLLSHSSRT
eukprot:6186695-Pleurochrysis_carterae.AAC.1